MRRADRLYRLIEELRGKRLVRARELALALEVSERTVYRDVADLVASGVPILGEAGVGYCLQAGFHLPPVMFTETEVEAAALGLRMAEAWGGEELAAAARAALSKIEAVLPQRLKERLIKAPLYAPDFHVPADLKSHLDHLRLATVQRRILQVGYQDAQGQSSQRRLWPLGLFFWGQLWTLAAWCEARQDFRTFRVDRLSALKDSGDSFPDKRGRQLADYLERVTRDEESRGR